MHSSSPVPRSRFNGRRTWGLAFLLVCATTLLHAQGVAVPLTLLEAKGSVGGVVSVRVNAPQATAISLMVDTMAAGDAQPLTRDDRGVWTGQVSGLAPDIYEAALIVGNTLRSIGSVTVPGNPQEVWEPRKVPHGEVHQLFYESGAIRGQRSVWVYTPPGYERDTKTQYPVLYLLHGSGGVEGSWVLDGAAHTILDNLIAAEKAQPMIVVMPFGHTEPSPRAGATPTFTGRDAAAFTADLIQDVMPLVEERFRIRRKPESRAIAGLSMGGGQARTIGLSMPDRFRWIGTFSGSMPGLRANPSPDAMEAMFGEDFLNDPVGTNSGISLLWMAVGDQEAGMMTTRMARPFTSLFSI